MSYRLFSAVSPSHFPVSYDNNLIGNIISEVIYCQFTFHGLIFMTETVVKRLIRNAENLISYTFYKGIDGRASDLLQFEKEKSIIIQRGRR